MLAEMFLIDLDVWNVWDGGDQGAVVKSKANLTKFNLRHVS